MGENLHTPESTDATLSQWICHCADADPADTSLGGKVRALAALGQAHFPIPSWFVVKPGAFDASLTPEMENAVSAATDAESLRTAINSLHPSPAVVQALEQALAQ